MTTQTFNGWTNYETWNVSLYIQNEFSLYQMAQECDTYQQFADLMNDLDQYITADGVSWTHPTLDHEELNEMIAEL